MNKFFKIINFLQKNLIMSIPLFMIGGIIFGTFSDPKMLKLTITPLTFMMVYPMMVGMNLKQLVSKGGKKVNLLAFLINFAIIPFVALLIGKIFFKTNSFLIVGLLLSALLPTSGMTISWTGFANGNMNAAVKMTIVGLISGSLLTPFYIKFLMGTSVEIPLISVFNQILLIVFIPMVLGNITQRTFIKKYGEEKFKKDIKVKFQNLSTVGVLGIVFAAMALKSKTIIDNPEQLLIYTAPIALLYTLNFMISTLVGKFTLKRDDAIALVYGTVMRNLSIALAIAMAVFKDKGAEVALIIALSYIIQVQSAAWYVKFTDKIFGKKQVEID